MHVQARHTPVLTPVLPNVSDRATVGQGGDVHVSRSRGLPENNADTTHSPLVKPLLGC